MEQTYLLLGFQLLTELNYVFFSLLLVIYSAWRYFKLKKAYMLYLSLCFALLALSMLFETLSSTLWFYIARVGISLRLVELSGLAFFAGFIITAIIALRKISQT